MYSNCLLIMNSYSIRNMQRIHSLEEIIYEECILLVFIRQVCDNILTQRENKTVYILSLAITTHTILLAKISHS